MNTFPVTFTWPTHSEGWAMSEKVLAYSLLRGWLIGRYVAALKPFWVDLQEKPIEDVAMWQTLPNEPTIQNDTRWVVDMGLTKALIIADTKQEVITKLARMCLPAREGFIWNIEPYNGQPGVQAKALKTQYAMFYCKAVDGQTVRVQWRYGGREVEIAIPDDYLHNCRTVASFLTWIIPRLGKAKWNPFNARLKGKMDELMCSSSEVTEKLLNYTLNASSSFTGDSTPLHLYRSK